MKKQFKRIVVFDFNNDDVVQFILHMPVANMLAMVRQLREEVAQRG